MYQHARKQARGISSIGMIRSAPSYPWRVYRSVAGEAPASLYSYTPGLGFTLNPFRLVKKAVVAVKSLLKQSTVTVPTDMGPVSIPVTRLPGLVRNASVDIGGKPSAIEQIGQAVESVPGGWATIAAVGIGAVVLATTMGRRR